MRARSSVLELAILGLLHAGPLHGYELRKRLNLMLGPLRAFSYGSLYPGLRNMQASGLIASLDTPAAGRSRIVYHLTDTGTDRFEKMLGEAGPASWEDENFDLRFAFFAQTDRETRLRVLEGRRSRMAERLEGLAPPEDSVPGFTNPYLLELQQHWRDQTERELRWLDELIATERADAQHFL